MTTPNLWDEATRDVEGEKDQRRVAYVTQAASEVWPFLAAAQSPQEYAARKAMAASRIEAAVETVAERGTGAFERLHAALSANLDADFETLHNSPERVAARTAAEARRASQLIGAELMRTASKTASTWYPITDTNGNHRLDDPESSGTFVDEKGIIHNGVSWAEAQQRDPNVKRSKSDIPVTVDKTSKTAGEYGGGSPKSGDKATCHKDDLPIQFFDGQWMHLSGGPSHNDVYPATPKERADKQGKTAADGFYRVTPSGTGHSLEWMPPYQESPEHSKYRELFPNGVPLHGDLTPEQERWLHPHKQSILSALIDAITDDDINAVLARGRRNDFSLSDAKNEEGEWTMSPEQIRAEQAADSEPYNDDLADDYYDDEPRRRRGSRHPFDLDDGLFVFAVAWGRRHYEDLAEFISTQDDREKLADHFAKHLRGTNPNYREDQFRQAASTKGYRVRGGTGVANYSRGHLQHIAEGIKSYPGDKNQMGEAFADYLNGKNPRFKRDTFLKATQAANDFHEFAQKTCAVCGGKVHPLGPGLHHLDAKQDDDHKFREGKTSARDIHDLRRDVGDAMKRYLHPDYHADGQAALDRTHDAVLDHLADMYGWTIEDAKSHKEHHDRVADSVAAHVYETHPFTEHAPPRHHGASDKWCQTCNERLVQKDNGEYKHAEYVSQRGSQRSHTPVPGPRHHATLHTAEEHGGYHLEQGDGGWYVVNHIGERKNKEPKSHDEALKYQRALMVNVPGAKEDAERHEKNSVLHPDKESGEHISAFALASGDWADWGAYFTVVANDGIKCPMCFGTDVKSANGYPGRAAQPDRYTCKSCGADLWGKPNKTGRLVLAYDLPDLGDDAASHMPGPGDSDTAGQCPQCGSYNTEMANTGAMGEEFSCNNCGYQGGPHGGMEDQTGEGGYDSSPYYASRTAAGEHAADRCEDCNGTGQVPSLSPHDDPDNSGLQTCPTCNGTGRASGGRMGPSQAHLTRSGEGPARPAGDSRHFHLIQPSGGKWHIYRVPRSQVGQGKSRNKVKVSTHATHEEAVRALNTLKGKTAEANPPQGGCQCEDASHFDNGGGHKYGAENGPLVPTTMGGIAVCPTCAKGHYSQFIRESAYTCVTCGGTNGGHAKWCPEPRQHEAVNTDGKGADRYQRTPAPTRPAWVTHWSDDDTRLTEEQINSARANEVGGNGAVPSQTVRPDRLQHNTYQPVASKIGWLDFQSAQQMLGQLDGHPVALTYDDDFGITTTAGTLAYAGRSVTVTSANGKAVTVPVQHVLNVTATGFGSARDANEGAGREPGVMDYLMHGNFPSGAMATRHTANPYSPNLNPYTTDGPGHPDKGGEPGDAGNGLDNGGPQGGGGAPTTTRPRVKPNTDYANGGGPGGGAGEADGFAMQQTPSTSTDNLHQQNTSAPWRAAASLREVEEWYASPARQKVAAKAKAIADDIQTTNPGMGRGQALGFAVQTIRAFPRTVGGIAPSALGGVLDRYLTELSQA